MFYVLIAGWSSLVARRAHNPKVAGSNPAPATNFFCLGGIAQLARACGSYPQCHWFESSYRHHLTNLTRPLRARFFYLPSNPFVGEQPFFHFDAFGKASQPLVSDHSMTGAKKENRV